MIFFFFLIVFLSQFLISQSHYSRYHSILLFDNTTKRGVPLVSLKTVNNVEYITDSNGYIAFHEEYLMNQPVWFYISSPGYEYDSVWGMIGATINTTIGGSTVLNIKRKNIAVRLYRTSGAGIYRDTIMLGKKSPIREPLLNAGVMGLDSTISTIFKGKVYWFFGDTNKAGFPLGNFHVSGAYSELPINGGLDPNIGINFHFFQEKGFTKSLAPIEPMNIPTWIHSVNTLKENNLEMMVGWYYKMAHLGQPERLGTIQWNDQKEIFELIINLNEKHNIKINGAHSFIHRDNNNVYIYFSSPYADVRVKANIQSFHNISEYESFTCLVEGTNISEEKIDRDQNGRLIYKWKKNTSNLSLNDYVQLMLKLKLQFNEIHHLKLREFSTERIILAHRGSIHYNYYRKKYIMILVETYGNPGMLGEVWYTESDTPEGPFYYGQKIATHDRINLYNPVHHSFFDQQGGRIIFFEGTFTSTFDIGHPVPYYNYNQLMYRLDLNDITLPLPVYFNGTIYSFEKLENSNIVWFSFPNKINGYDMEPIYQDGKRLSKEKGKFVFYSLKKSYPNSIPVFETKKNGTFYYEPNYHLKQNPLFIVFRKF